MRLAFQLHAAERWLHLCQYDLSYFSYPHEMYPHEIIITGLRIREACSCQPYPVQEMDVIDRGNSNEGDASLCMEHLTAAMSSGLAHTGRVSIVCASSPSVSLCCLRKLWNAP